MQVLLIYKCNAKITQSECKENLFSLPRCRLSYVKIVQCVCKDSENNDNL